MMFKHRASILSGMFFAASAFACSGSDAVESTKTPAAVPTDGTGPEPPAAPSADGGGIETPDAGLGPDASPPPAPDAGVVSQCGTVTGFPTVVEETPGPPREGEWNDFADVMSSDGQGASVVLSQVYPRSRDLYVRGFGLAVPPGTKIEGIVVEITRQSTAEMTTDANVQLRKKTASSNAALGDDQRRTGPWLVGPYHTATYGSASSQWGASLSPTTVNAASFAVRIAVANSELFGPDEAVVRLDAVKMTVHYCP